MAVVVACIRILFRLLAVDTSHRITETGVSAAGAAGGGGCWDALAGAWVVLDLRSPFVCIGKLVRAEAGFIVLDEADLHDLRDTATTRERYVLETREHGVRANRRTTWIHLHEVVAVTRLADVICE